MFCSCFYKLRWQTEAASIFLWKSPIFSEIEFWIPTLTILKPNFGDVFGQLNPHNLLGIISTTYHKNCVWLWLTKITLLWSTSIQLWYCETFQFPLWFGSFRNLDFFLMWPCKEKHCDHQRNRQNRHQNQRNFKSHTPRIFNKKISF